MSASFAPAAAPANCMSNLPTVQTESLSKWGETIAARVIGFATLHQRYGSVIIEQTLPISRDANGRLMAVPGPNPHAGEPYDPSEFLAHTMGVAGLPYTLPEIEAVKAAAESTPGFDTALQYLVAISPNDLVND